MPALSAARLIEEKEGIHSTAPVKGSTTIFQGALVVMAAGLAVPGSTATGLTVLGVAVETVVNDGDDGDASITTKRGTFRFHNLGADAVTAAEIGQDCFIVDDQTVAKTSATDTRSVAGKVIDVDANGVWVSVG
jgi:hypothetical protein